MILIDFTINLRVFALGRAFELFPPDFREFFESRPGPVTFSELCDYWDGHRELLSNEDVIGASYMLAYIYVSLQVTKNEAANEKFMQNAFLLCSFICDSAEATENFGDESKCRHFPYACEVMSEVGGIIHWLALSEPQEFDTIVLLLEKRHKGEEDERNETKEQKLHFSSRTSIVTVKASFETKMRSVFACYSAEVNAKEGAAPVSFKSLRFLHSGRRLYISEMGNKTVRQAGFRDGTVIICGDPATAPDVPCKVDVKNTRLRSTPSSSGGRKGARTRKQAKTKKKRGGQVAEYKTQRDASSYRIEHSKKLSLVFEEVDATFKAIRLKLNNLDLKRTPPKRPGAAAARPKEEAPAAQAFKLEPECGKAGKIFYDVKVGEVTSLYKTSKPSPKSGLDHVSSISIDLHGCTRDEGRAKLDSHLPEWVQMALEGSSPWVIRVRIICGGGNQVLSEMVEGWIRHHETVAKAFRC